MRKSSQCFSIRRCIALLLINSFLLNSFLLTNLSPQSLYAQSPKGASRTQDPHSLAIRPDAMAALGLPSELGTIEEKFDATKDQGFIPKVKNHRTQVTGHESLVILVQDAHSSGDAQNSIRRIVEHYEKQGVSLMTLEGASGKLDTELFRSFPDKEKLKEIFNAYLKKGELSGAAVHAVLSPFESDYYGVEDKKLYEEGVRLFLAAVAGQPELASKLQSEGRRLETQKKKYYSSELLELDSKIKTFGKEDTDLISLLEYLVRAFSPSEGVGKNMKSRFPHLADYFSEIKAAHPKDFSPEIEKAINVILKAQDDKKTFQEKLQAYRTERMPPAAFAHYLSNLSGVKFSSELQDEADRYGRLNQIRGGEFMEELENYILELKEALFRNETERKIDQKDQQLRLLEHLVHLKLTRKEWEELKKLEARNKTQGKGKENTVFSASDFSPLASYLFFYHNAEAREEALQKKLLKLMDKHKTRVALFVAGGFHSSAMANYLKQSGISYVLISPAIQELPDEGLYERHMQGEVSWKNYFKIKTGRIDLFDSFARAAVDQLLGNMSQVTSHKAQENKTTGALVSLKSWRDQLIRNLAVKEKTAKAGRYTRFLDEAAVNLMDPVKKEALQKEWLAKVDQFISGLRLLKEKNQLTAQNMINLTANPATKVAVQHPFAAGVFIPGSSSLLPAPKSELRSESPEESDDLIVIQAVAELAEAFREIEPDSSQLKEKLFEAYQELDFIDGLGEDESLFYNPEKMLQIIFRSRLPQIQITLEKITRPGSLLQSHREAYHQLYAALTRLQDTHRSEVRSQTGDVEDEFEKLAQNAELAKKAFRNIFLNLAEAGNLSGMREAGTLSTLQQDLIKLYGRLFGESVPLRTVSHEQLKKEQYELIEIWKKLKQVKNPEGFPVAAERFEAAYASLGEMLVSINAMLDVQWPEGGWPAKGGLSAPLTVDSLYKPGPELMDEVNRQYQEWKEWSETHTRSIQIRVRYADMDKPEVSEKILGLPEWTDLKSITSDIGHIKLVSGKAYETAWRTPESDLYENDNAGAKVVEWALKAWPRENAPFFQVRAVQDPSYEDEIYILILGRKSSALPLDETALALLGKEDIPLGERLQEHWETWKNYYWIAGILLLLGIAAVVGPSMIQKAWPGGRSEARTYENVFDELAWDGKLNEILMDEIRRVAGFLIRSSGPQHEIPGILQHFLREAIRLSEKRNFRPEYPPAGKALDDLERLWEVPVYKIFFVNFVAGNREKLPVLGRFLYLRFGESSFKEFQRQSTTTHVLDWDHFKDTLEAWAGKAKPVQFLQMPWNTTPVAIEASVSMNVRQWSASLRDQLEDRGLKSPGNLILEIRRISPGKKIEPAGDIYTLIIGLSKEVRSEARPDADASGQQNRFRAGRSEVRTKEKKISGESGESVSLFVQRDTPAGLSEELRKNQRLPRAFATLPSLAAKTTNLLKRVPQTGKARQGGIEERKPQTDRMQSKLQRQSLQNPSRFFQQHPGDWVQTLSLAPSAMGASLFINLLLVNKKMLIKEKLVRSEARPVSEEEDAAQLLGYEIAPLSPGVLEQLPGKNPGERVRIIREMREFQSASAFAKKAGIPQSTYAEIESKGILPGLSNLVKIASALKIDPVLILEGKNLSEALQTMNIHQKIALHRKRLGWNQTELIRALESAAQAAGVRFFVSSESSDETKRTLVKNWENSRLPMPDKWVILEKVLGDPHLFDGIKPEAKTSSLSRTRRPREIQKFSKEELEKRAKRSVSAMGLIAKRERLRFTPFYGVIREAVYLLEALDRQNELESNQGLAKEVIRAFDETLRVYAQKKKGQEVPHQVKLIASFKKRADVLRDKVNAMPRSEVRPDADASGQQKRFRTGRSEVREETGKSLLMGVHDFEPDAAAPNDPAKRHFYPDWWVMRILGQELYAARLARPRPVKLADIAANVRKKIQGHGFSGERYDDLQLQALLERMEQEYGLLEKAGDDGYKISVNEKVFLIRISHFRAIHEQLTERLNFTPGQKNAEKALEIFLKGFSDAIRLWPRFPVESAWPILRAMSTLSEENKKKLAQFLEAPERAALRTEPLIDSMLYILTEKISRDWLKEFATSLKGSTLYYISPETWLAAGGLGRVGQYHTLAAKLLTGSEASLVTVEPYYVNRLTLKQSQTGDWQETVVKDVDYSKLPVPVQNLQIWKTFEIFVNKQGRRTPVQVEILRGTNEYGIEVFLYRDKPEKAGEEPYFTKLLYSYGQHGNAQVEEFTEFASKVSLKISKKIEHEKQMKASGKKPPVFWANDGQTALLPLFKLISDDIERMSPEEQERIKSDPTHEYHEYRDLIRENDEVSLLDADVLQTTHTYRNRVIKGPKELIDGLRLPARYHGYLHSGEWLYLQDGRYQNAYDATSAGVRGAWAGLGGANGVAAIHAEEMNPLDEGAELNGNTNGDDRKASRREFDAAFKARYPQGDSENPSPEELAETKKLAKKRLSENAKLNELNPLFIQIDPEKMLITYSGRMVDEKIGDVRAFTVENIEALVRAGAQIVLAGNVQSGNEKSREIYLKLKKIEARIAEERKKAREQGDMNFGLFIVVSGWSIPEQRFLLAASDLQVNDSDRDPKRGTEAAGITETNVMNAGGLEMSSPFLEAIFHQQGEVLDWADPSSGNTIIPESEKPEDYRKAMLRALEEYQKDRLRFARFQVTSIQFSKSLAAVPTAASYLRFIHEIRSRRKDPEALWSRFFEGLRNPRLQSVAWFQDSQSRLFTHLWENLPRNRSRDKAFFSARLYSREDAEKVFDPGADRFGWWKDKEHSLMNSDSGLAGMLETFRRLMQNQPRDLWNSLEYHAGRNDIFNYLNHNLQGYSSAIEPLRKRIQALESQSLKTNNPDEKIRKNIEAMDLVDRYLKGLTMHLLKQYFLLPGKFLYGKELSASMGTWFEKLFSNVQISKIAARYLDAHPQEARRLNTTEKGLRAYWISNDSKAVLAKGGKAVPAGGSGNPHILLLNTGAIAYPDKKDPGLKKAWGKIAVEGPFRDWVQEHLISAGKAAQVYDSKKRVDYGLYKVGELLEGLKTGVPGIQMLGLRVKKSKALAADLTQSPLRHAMELFNALRDPVLLTEDKLKELLPRDRAIAEKKYSAERLPALMALVAGLAPQHLGRAAGWNAEVHKRLQKLSVSNALLLKKGAVTFHQGRKGSVVFSRSLGDKNLVFAVELDRSFINAGNKKTWFPVRDIGSADQTKPLFLDPAAMYAIHDRIRGGTNNPRSGINLLRHWDVGIPLEDIVFGGKTIQQGWGFDVYQLELMQDLQPARVKTTGEEKQEPQDLQILEINTRAYMKEHGLKSFDDLTLKQLKEMKAAGYNTLWMMGVYEESLFSKEFNRYWGEKKNVDGGQQTSAFAIPGYTINPDFGGEAAFKALAERAKKAGLHLMLDYIPNHFALDSPLIQDHPDWFVHMTTPPADADRENRFENPTGYFPVELKDGRMIWVARATDGLSGPWGDTAQLNYLNPEVWKFMAEQLLYLAKLTNGGGVRVDSLQVLTPEVFRKLWVPYMLPGDFENHMQTVSRLVFGREPHNRDNVFGPMFAWIKEQYPDFKILGEVYHQQEGYWQDAGVDITYAKYVYDWLVEGKAGGWQAFKNYVFRSGHDFSLDYAFRSLYFLENHDERVRVLKVLGGKLGKNPEDPEVVAWSRLLAAAISTIPGAPLFYEGQEDGRSRHSSSANWFPDKPWLAAHPDTNIPGLKDFYKQLLRQTSEPVFRRGGFPEGIPHQGGNPDLLAFTRRYDGRAGVVVLNHSREVVEVELDLGLIGQGKKKIRLEPWGQFIEILEDKTLRRSEARETSERLVSGLGPNRAVRSEAHPDADASGQQNLFRAGRSEARTDDALEKQGVEWFKAVPEILLKGNLRAEIAGLTPENLPQKEEAVLIQLLENSKKIVDDITRRSLKNTITPKERAVYTLVHGFLMELIRRQEKIQVQGETPEDFRKFWKTETEALLYGPPEDQDWQRPRWVFLEKILKNLKIREQQKFVLEQLLSDPGLTRALRINYAEHYSQLLRQHFFPPPQEEILRALRYLERARNEFPAFLREPQVAKEENKHGQWQSGLLQELAINYFLAGREYWPQARNEAARALAIHPDLPFANLLEYHIKKLLGDLKPDPEFVERYLKIFPPEEAAGWRLYFRAYEAFLREDMQEAVQLYGELFRIDPGFIITTGPYYALALAKLGQSAEAGRILKLFFEELATAQKNTPELEKKRKHVFDLAFLFVSRENIQEALRLIDDILQNPGQWPESPEAFREMVAFSTRFHDPDTAEFLIRNVFSNFFGEYSGQTLVRWENLDILFSSLFSIKPIETRIILSQLIESLRYAAPEVTKKMEEFLFSRTQHTLESSLEGLIRWLAMEGRAQVSVRRNYGSAIRLKIIDFFQAELLSHEENPEALFQLILVLGPKLRTTDFIIFLHAASEVLIDHHSYKLSAGAEALKIFEEKLRKFFSGALEKYEYLWENETGYSEMISFYGAMSRLSAEVGNAQWISRFYGKFFKTFYVLEKKEQAGKTLQMIPSAIQDFASYADLILQYFPGKKEEELQALLQEWERQNKFFLARIGKTPQPRRDIEAGIWIKSILLISPLLWQRILSREPGLQKTLGELLRFYSSILKPDDFEVAIKLSSAAYALEDMESFRLFSEHILPRTEKQDLPIRHAVEVASILSKKAYDFRGRLSPAAESDFFETAQDLIAKLKESKAPAEDAQAPAQREFVSAIFEMIRKQFRAAIEILERPGLLELSPELEPQKNFLLALAYLFAGDPSHAREILKDNLVSLAGKPAEKEQSLEASAKEGIIELAFQLPHDYRAILVESAAEILFSETGKSSAEIARMLEFTVLLGPRQFEEKALKYLERLSEGYEKGVPERDSVLAGWLAENSPDKARVYFLLDALIGFLQKNPSDQAKGPSRGGVTNLVKIRDGLLRGLTNRDYLKIADFKFTLGQYKESLDAAVSALKRAKTGPEKLRAENFRDQVVKTHALSEKMKKLYADGNYDAAIDAAANLLDPLNPRDPAAQRIQANSLVLKQIRNLAENGKIEEAVEHLEAIPGAQADKQTKMVAEALDFFNRRLAKAAKGLDENFYLQARKTLDQALADLQRQLKLPRLSIPENGDFSRVVRRIEEVRRAADRFAAGVKASDSLKDTFESAKNLMAYPERRDDAVQILLERAYRVFNRTRREDEKWESSGYPSLDPATALHREEEYKKAFNLARLVYELTGEEHHEVKPVYLQKAQELISYAAAQIWIPGLLDAYFMTSAMVRAEEQRENREKRDKVDFHYGNLSLEADGIFLDGFRYFQKKKMLDYVKMGDAFQIRLRNEKEPLPVIFTASGVGSDYLELEFPKNENIDRKVLLQDYLKQGGELVRVRSTELELKRDMLRDRLNGLMESSARKPEWEKPPGALATTGDTMANYLLGMRMDIPDREKMLQLEEKKRYVRTIVTAMEETFGPLDDAQREGIIQAIPEDVPYVLFQGPGGTGKTTVILWLLRIFLGQGKRINVYAHSNPAVDNILRRIFDLPDDEKIRPFIARAANRPDSISDPKVMKLWEERFGKDGESVFDKIGRPGKASALFGTINGLDQDRELANRPRLRTPEIGILDEASTANVTDTLYAGRNKKKLVLSGDQAQLSAVLVVDETVEAVKKELGAGVFFPNDRQIKFGGRAVAARKVENIFESGIINQQKISLLEKNLGLFFDGAPGKDTLFKVTQPPFYFLDKQRRSGSRIVEPASEVFYEKKLIPGKMDASGNLVKGEVIIADSKGRYPEERLGLKGEQIINRGEADTVIVQLGWLINQKKIAPKEITLISPYKGQVQLLTRTLFDFAVILEYLKAVETQNLRTETPQEMRDIFASDGVRFRSREAAYAELLAQDAGFAVQKPAVREKRIDQHLDQGYRKKLTRFFEHPDPESARWLHRFLGQTWMPQFRQGWGENFIPSEMVKSGILKIMSADSAIGHENEAVIVSLTRSNPSRSVGFLGKVEGNEGKKRLNVLSTRSREILILNMDSSTWLESTQPDARKWAEVMFRQARKYEEEDARLRKSGGAKSEVRPDADASGQQNRFRTGRSEVRIAARIVLQSIALNAPLDARRVSEQIKMDFEGFAKKLKEEAQKERYFNLYAAGREFGAAGTTADSGAYVEGLAASSGTPKNFFVRIEKESLEDLDLFLETVATVGSFGHRITLAAPDRSTAREINGQLPKFFHRIDPARMTELTGRIRAVHLPGENVLPVSSGADGRMDAIVPLAEGRTLLRQENLRRQIDRVIVSDEFKAGTGAREIRVEKQGLLLKARLLLEAALTSKSTNALLQAGADLSLFFPNPELASENLSAFLTGLNASAQKILTAA